MLVVEIILRLGGAVAPGDYPTVDLTTTSEQFGRLNMANRAGAKRTSEFSTHVRVNSAGLRGPEIPYEKPPGTYRVLVLGDSFTFGAQVEEDQTFVARLGDRLRRQSAGSPAPAIETINGGVDGWNTYNELAWLEVEGVRYAPNLVVLIYYTGNDPGDNFDWMKALKRREVGAPPPPPSPIRTFRKALAGTSAVYALFESGVLAKFTTPLDPAARDVSQVRTRRSQDPDRKDRGWEISGDLFGRMQKVCHEHNSKLLVVGIPTLENVVDAERPFTPFQAVAATADVPAIDLLDPLRSASPSIREALYFPKDRHWTAAGHDLAAEYVASYLLDAGFVLTAGP